MSDRPFKQLLQVAAEISDRAADITGFVPLHALAREVHAEIRFRPLLVEGIAAQPKEKDGRWLILIDSETHQVSEDMLLLENATNPLGARLRNTVAHELAHALGPRFEASRVNHKSRTERVEDLEQETEQLSPALLISPRAMEALLDQRTEAFNLDELVTARDRLGVSSRVMVKRLELLNQDPESRFRFHPRLDNLVIGSGEWLSSTKAELHPMPFRGTRGLVPEFVNQLRTHKKVSIGECFIEPNFYLNLGVESTSQAKLWLGTGAQPKSEQGVVNISVEVVPRKAGTVFLWIARLS